VSDVAITNDLLKMAELIIEYRGYDETDVTRGDSTIDILASNSESNEGILVRVVTNPKNGASVIGVDKAKEMRETLAKLDVKHGVILGDRFTNAAKRVLNENSIEFFTGKQNIIKSINPEQLYVKINEFVEQLCEERCGKQPLSASECSGVTKEAGEFKEYTCTIRQISDNADVHYEHRWWTLLQNDLRDLLSLVILQKNRAGNAVESDPN
jgi:hypothetical protein